MKRFLLAFLLSAGVLSCAACGDPPKVVQGKVRTYDAAAQSLVVRDERAPEQDVAFSLEAAELGAEPQTDDVVRVAYREAGGRHIATRVMNLTRQKELGAQVKP